MAFSQWQQGQNPIMKCRRFKKRTGLGPHLPQQISVSTCNLLFLPSMTFSQWQQGQNPIMKCRRFKKRTGLGPHLACQIKCQPCNLLYLRSADFNPSKPGVEPRVAGQSDQKEWVLFGALAGKRIRPMQLSVFEPPISRSQIHQGGA
jgi:hypothetical protein